MPVPPAETIPLIMHRDVAARVERQRRRPGAAARAVLSPEPGHAGGDPLAAPRPTRPRRQQLPSVPDSTLLEPSNMSCVLSYRTARAACIAHGAQFKLNLRCIAIMSCARSGVRAAAGGLGAVRAERGGGGRFRRSGAEKNLPRPVRAVPRGHAAGGVRFCRPGYISGSDSGGPQYITPAVCQCSTRACCADV